MKLVCIYTLSHKFLKDEWFLPSLKDDYVLSIHGCDVVGAGKYMDADWVESVLFKSQKIIEAIKEYWGDIFIYSDVDIQFFAPTKEKILKAIVHKDIVCQLDDPQGDLCTGFFAVRANALSLRLWEDVHKAIKRERRDQPAFNRIIRAMGDIRYGYLPFQVFGTGTFKGTIWSPRTRFYLIVDNH